MPINIISKDITEFEVDAIVICINDTLKIDYIIEKAGKEKIIKAYELLPPLKTNEVVITDGFDLYAKKIIHITGSTYDIENLNESYDLLKQGYLNCLELAKKNNIKSIAFTLISSGKYGYPKDVSFNIAKETILHYLNDNELDVFIAIDDVENFSVNQKLINNVDKFLEDNLIVENFDRSLSYQIDCEESIQNIDEFIENLDESFSVALLKLIDKKSKTDVEVYKKANIDRRLFSKIRKGKGYNPSKKTILALSISLELSLIETNDLLNRAGYTLSHSKKFDVIIEYFIINEKYDIYEINDVLFKYNQALLGS